MSDINCDNLTVAGKATVSNLIEVCTEGQGPSQFGSVQAVKHLPSHDQIPPLGLPCPLVLQPHGGNVGIGTVDPNTKLSITTEVQGQPALSITSPEHSTSGGMIFITSLGKTNDAHRLLTGRKRDLANKAWLDWTFEIYKGDEPALGFWRAYRPDDNPGGTKTQFSTPLVLGWNGNVGIGTAEPRCKLSIQTEVQGQPGLSITSPEHNTSGGMIFISSLGKSNEAHRLLTGRKRNSANNACLDWTFEMYPGDEPALGFWRAYRPDNDPDGTKVEWSIPLVLGWNGNVGIGVDAPQAKLDVAGDLLLSGDFQITTRRGLLQMGTTDGSHATNGEVVGGIGFRGDSVQHGQLSFRAGQGFELVDRSSDAPSLGYARDSYPYADLTLRTLTATGDVVLSGADCAEEFDIGDAEASDAGTVMVISPDGALVPSDQAYDRRVAGVISGAGDLRPGITLDKQQASEGRLPLALAGKVCCKVDADYGHIEVGDLLTTSPTTGHAMKASDPGKAFGTVIGKALRALEGGKGLIPILIALQ